jgi:hypothetical protein
MGLLFFVWPKLLNCWYVTDTKTIKILGQSKTNFISFDEGKYKYFRGHQEHMRNMDRMFQDPFGMFGGHPMLQGPGRDNQQRRSMTASQRNNDMAMSPFGSFGGMFGNMFMNMNSMMSNMERTFVSK